MRITALLCVLAASVVGACRSYAPCEQAQEQVRTVLESCGVAVANDQQEVKGECTQKQQATEECIVGCYAKASCADILAQDDAGYTALPYCAADCGRGR